MVEICMPLKLFVLKITSNVLIYLIIGETYNEIYLKSS